MKTKFNRDFLLVEAPLELASLINCSPFFYTEVLDIENILCREKFLTIAMAKDFSK